MTRASPTTALVCVNGQATPELLASIPLSPDSLLVAVDGGLRLALSLTDELRHPDYLIGDLDSVGAAALAQIEANGHTQIVRHPTEKNETDLELALELLSARGVDHVVLVGISGGRLDQVLGNMLLLAARDWPFSIDFYGVDGTGHLLTPQRSWSAALAPGSVVSLLPLSQLVSGITTTGLYYPLSDATLVFGSPRGLSNVIEASTSTVTLNSGKLLLIMPPDEAIDLTESQINRNKLIDN